MTIVHGPEQFYVEHIPESLHLVNFWGDRSENNLIKVAFSLDSLKISVRIFLHKILIPVST